MTPAGTGRPGSGARAAVRRWWKRDRFRREWRRREHDAFHTDPHAHAVYVHLNNLFGVWK